MLQRFAAACPRLRWPRMVTSSICPRRRSRCPPTPPCLPCAPPSPPTAHSRRLRLHHAPQMSICHLWPRVVPLWTICHRKPLVVPSISHSLHSRVLLSHHRPHRRPTAHSPRSHPTAHSPHSPHPHSPLIAHSPRHVAPTTATCRPWAPMRSHTVSHVPLSHPHATSPIVCHSHRMRSPCTAARNNCRPRSSPRPMPPICPSITPSAPPRLSAPRRTIAMLLEYWATRRCSSAPWRLPSVCRSPTAWYPRVGRPASAVAIPTTLIPGPSILLESAPRATSGKQLNQQPIPWYA